MVVRRDYLPGRIKRFLVQHPDFGHFSNPAVDLLAAYVESFLRTLANGLAERAVAAQTQTLTPMELKHFVEARKDLDFLKSKVALVQHSDAIRCKKRKTTGKIKINAARKVASKKSQKRSSMQIKIAQPGKVESQLQKSIEENDNYDESE